MLEVEVRGLEAGHHIDISEGCVRQVVAVPINLWPQEDLFSSVFGKSNNLSTVAMVPDPYPIRGNLFLNLNFKIFEEVDGKR